MLLAEILNGVVRLASPPPLSKADDLVVEEYKTCGELNLTKIKIIEKNEIYVISAVSAIFLFGLAIRNVPVFRMQGVVAFIVAALGAMRYFALDHVIDVTDTYLMKIEKRMPVEGWSTVLRQKRKRPARSDEESSLDNNAFYYILMDGVLSISQSNRRLFALAHHASASGSFTASG